MGYKVLYRKYRPDDFDNVVGQEYTIDMLKKSIISGHHSHAYIFTGPRGTGKTSSAKLFAKALNCENPKEGNPCNCCNSCLSFKENPDIIEIDAASNNGVDEIRELINNVKLVPTASKYKVYIIDEVHMLTASAFNALLLTLEEPPSHVVFILATTDIQDVPITILSRCQRFDFKPINKVSIVDRLRHVCELESISCNDEALNEIALLSAGGMRDALGMLDQLSANDREITLEIVSDYFGSISAKKINELLTSIENANIDEFLESFKSIKESGTNYSVFIEKLIYELRKTAISLKTGKVKHDFCFNDIYGMIFDLNECLCNVNINIDPYVLIEIVLLKYINRLGNNIDNNSEVNNLGNNKSNTGNNNKNMGNNIDSINNKNDKLNNSTGNKVINKQEVKFDINIRINNCFVGASREQKSSISKSWIDFMNYLMAHDRQLVSMLADTIILAASDKYVLIESAIDSTNDLINANIRNLEQKYSDFAGNNLLFCAISEKIWSKEVEKYRINLKNKIKYSYMEEDNATDEINDESLNIDDKEDIEDVAREIFGTYETE